MKDQIKIIFIKVKESEFFKKISAKAPLILLTGMGSLILLSYLNGYVTKPKSMDEKSEEIGAADTLIPKGFVLVPIDLKNADSLGHLIENFAVVDLYSSPLNPGELGRRVGHHLTLLRAPLNPNSFAVLVPDNDASRLMSGAGPLVAVLQNRESRTEGGGGLDKKNRPPRRVEYYVDKKESKNIIHDSKKYGEN